MKNAKHWLSVLLSVAVVLTMAITPAMATGTDDSSAATITVETVTKAVTAGEEVTLNVSLADNPGFAGLDFTVVYDQNKLELKDVVKGALLSNGFFTPNAKQNKVVFANSELLSGDGALFTLKFIAKTDSDNAKVDIVNNGFTGIHNESFQVNIIPGGVNVPGSTTGGSTTGGSTTGGSTTGGSTTGGSTTGGSTTGGSTTGGSTTGGSTTGGSTTGGSTTGGSTTGGSTTGGSTTGGSTTGGSTTGGSTTGGSTTGGSTTGGSTTGGSTTGGGTTGGGTTGGGSTGGSGSSGGGSSSSSRRYDVSAPSVKHGDVTVDPKNAKAGDTVTITVKPDSGYELDTLTVKDASGSTIKVKDNGNGKFTFTMPSSKVTVSAEFAEIKAMDFVDVPSSAYYYDAVKWAAKKGITGGIGSGLFGPDQPCTRAHIVTFLWRAAGSPEPKSTVSFADVPADSYYAKAVAWAVENGITLGTGDGTFSPNATCTRAQSVTFLYRALGTAPTTAIGFTDVAANAFYTDAVAWAVENGVTNGTTDSTFSPDNGCTRAQIVTFLFRAYQGK